MLKLIHRKLHSRAGASLVITLIFFLLCIIVGGAILTAASANAGRFSHARQEQQAYLTVSAAARMLRDEIVDQSIDLFSEEGQEGYYDSKTVSEGAMVDQLRAWAFAAKNGSPVQQAKLTISGDDGFDLPAPVEAVLTMDLSCRITVKLHLAGSPPSDYFLLLNIYSHANGPNPIVSDEPDPGPVDPDAEQEPQRFFTTITWTSPNIQPGQEVTP